MLKLFKTIIIIICFLLANCGGGNRCLNPEIMTNKINIKKELFTDSKKVKIDKNRHWIASMHMFKAQGYFKKGKINVFLREESVPPLKKISCYDDANNLLWVYPNDNRPYKMTANIYVYETKNESFVILFEEDYRNDNIYDFVQSVVILNEDGKPTNELVLPASGDTYKYRLGTMTAQTIFGKHYLVADGGHGIGIFDFNTGKMISHLSTEPASPMTPEGIELEKNGKKHIVFYTDFRNYWKSSKIFILSDSWELLYEEVFPSGWFFGQLSGTKNSFIIKTFEIKDCKETGKDIIWKYTINP
jgi:hypothetical protein